jgi:hypothetical protein
LGISLSIFVSIHPLLDDLSPPTPFAIVAWYPFTSPSYSFSISSTLTFSMAKDGICNTNGHGDNNAINPPSLE